MPLGVLLRGDDRTLLVPSPGNRFCLYIYTHAGVTSVVTVLSNHSDRRPLCAPKHHSAFAHETYLCLWLQRPLKSSTALPAYFQLFYVLYNSCFRDSPSYPTAISFKVLYHRLNPLLTDLPSNISSVCFCLASSSQGLFCYLSSLGRPDQLHLQEHML